MWYSSLDHSIAVALIIWHFTKDRKQTLSGLFHDIATPVFKHTIDFMNKDYEKQESTEELTTKIISESKEIMELLNRDGIKVEEVADYHIYPIADNDTPCLSSDRLEYTLSNGLGATEKIWTLDDVKEIYDNIEIQEDENGIEELGFKDIAIAEKFVHTMSILSRLYRREKTLFTMQMLADIMRIMSDNNLINISEMYNLSEKEVIEKIEKCNVKKEHIEELFLQIDKDLIQYIDANDNGQSTKIDTDYKLVELASVISAFNPCWNETVDTDECFMQAYEIAKKYFERFIAREIAKNEAKELVENAIENSKEGIMILEQFMPWEEAVLTSTNPKAEKINFVVFPSNRGGFCVHTVPKELGSFENRKSLPKEWAGLRDEKLQVVSKIKTAKFCHNAGFICTAETREDAIKMAEIAQRA